MKDLQVAFERYKKERPSYVLFVDEVQRRVKDACRRAGILCSVSGRAKELDSFVKKLMRQPQSYESVYDKAGVRVIPAYPDDRDGVAKVIREIFDVTWSKDFVEETENDRFGYRGLHFTVGLREEARAGLAPDVMALVAELQVHTPGESIWATINHDLIYKTHQTVPPDIRRSLNRLSALLELVDIGMGDARRRVLGQDGAEEAQILGAIEKFFLRFTGRPYDLRLSMTILKSLRPLVADVNAFSIYFEGFVALNRDKLEYVYSEYESDVRHILLGQPESLLVFFFLEEDRSGMEKCWPDAVPFMFLESLYSVWIPANS